MSNEKEATIFDIKTLKLILMHRNVISVECI